jgi:hypothetical protein
MFRFPGIHGLGMSRTMNAASPLPSKENSNIS